MLPAHAGQADWPHHRPIFSPVARLILISSLFTKFRCPRRVLIAAALGNEGAVVREQGAPGNLQGSCQCTDALAVALPERVLSTFWREDGHLGVLGPYEDCLRPKNGSGFEVRLMPVPDFSAAEFFAILATKKSIRRREFFFVCLFLTHKFLHVERWFYELALNNNFLQLLCWNYLFLVFFVFFLSLLPSSLHIFAYYTSLFCIICSCSYLLLLFILPACHHPSCFFSYSCLLLAFSWLSLNRS